MGAVATWRIFQYGLDCFRYFLPMSCGTTLDDKEIFAAAKRYSLHDYFVFVITGSNDFAYSYDKARTELMKKSQPYFIDIDDRIDGNFAFRIKQGYSHDMRAAMEYIYNGLKAFWGVQNDIRGGSSEVNLKKNQPQKDFTVNTKIEDVIKYPAFKDFGRLLFPTNKNYYSGNTLGELSLTWYNNINPNKTVEIVNYLKEKADSGEAIFYDIYSNEERSQDPSKKDTGLFFFRGKKGAKTAIVVAGGGFVYVGAMQDSFPHALELCKKGYNAFALIYRPGVQTGCEDLARAIAFLHENADRLEIDMRDYSLWGGSAGARLVAWVGSYGTENFSDKQYPRPAVVIMQYTALSEVTGKEPPTFACVGTNDPIVPYKTMEDRINRIKANGTDAEIKIFQGLSHGFGLGEGTIAEGWINDAIKFWEKHMKK